MHYLLSSTRIVVCQTDVLKHMLSMIWLVSPWNLWETKLYRISLLSIGLMISIIWKSSMLLAHHGDYIPMDRFVMMVKELVLLLFLWMVLFLSSQTDQKRIAQIIKLSMKRSYLAWNFCNLWAWNMAFGDSFLVVQQVFKVRWWYNGYLNAYLDKCLDIISFFDEFVIRFIPREENGQTITLAKQVSG